MKSPEKVRAWRRGHLAEMIAAAFLFLKGYRILVRRFKTPVGEIDLIACRGAAIVFIEVKQRRTLSEALDAISPTNKTRVIRAAEWFLSSSFGRRLVQSRSISAPLLRFDAIVLAPPFSIRHIPNAWA